MSHLIIPELQPDHWLFKGERPILLPGGHGWRDHKPTPEYQLKNGFDDNNCSNHGTNHALEALASLLDYFDFPSNCSARYTGVETGTTPDGNDPHHVIEVIRTKCGEIPEKALPFDETIGSYDAYYHPNPMTPDFEALGKQILDKFQINHEWVTHPSFGMTVAEKQAAIKDALQRGPVCVSVFAWERGADGSYYKQPGQVDEHWVWLMDFVDGQSWTIFDDYDPIEKDLVFAYDFNMAKVYYMNRKLSPAERTALVIKIYQTLIALYEELLAKPLGALFGNALSRLNGIWRP